MKVGIIIGIYNNESHVAETIASVKNQTLNDWTCIIIDNGSSDASSEIAQSEIAADNRFRFIQKQNEGPSVCRNLGFAELQDQNDYIHFLDGDDILKETFLEVLCKYLDETPKAGIAACQFDIIDEASNFVSSGHRSRFAPGLLGFPRQLKPREIHTPFESFFSATGQGPFAIFRRKFFKQTNGYETSFWSHEDSDIFCQMSLVSEVHYLPDRLYQKRTHGNNLTHSPRANYRQFRDKWDFYSTDNPEVNRRVDAAFRYYYGKHAPFRDLKVCMKAFRNFITSGRVHSLKWSFECGKKGVAGLLFKTTLKKRRALCKHQYVANN